MTAGRHIFLIAGEASGDRLGASLMAALKTLDPHIRFSGVGGPLMTDEGLISLFPMDDLSVMGLAEVLPKLPVLLARVRQGARAVIDAAPDALVTIDSPDFCLRVAARVKAARPDLRTIHYVAPTVWAWRPERAVKMARHIDHVLALFPFEPPYMEAAGMGCDFVGHPVVASPAPDPSAIAAFRAGLGLGENERLLLVLPGSRKGEVGRMAPVFAAAAPLIKRACPATRLVIPATANVAGFLAEAVKSWPVPPVLLDPRSQTLSAFEAQKRAAFAAADVALAASGTVSLELAKAGTPMVIAYNFNWLTTRIVKKKVSLRSATLVNILTDSAAIPEFLFEDCTAENIAPKVIDLLQNPAARRAQKGANATAMAMLGEGGEAPGMRAARAVLAQLG